MKTCAACGASNAPENRFCASCGAALSAAVPRGAVRRSPTTRGSVRRAAKRSSRPSRPAPSASSSRCCSPTSSGSTTLGEQLDPERLRDVLDTYFSAMREEIEAEGGTVEKFIGDAVMAAFGVPVAHEDDPARALQGGAPDARPARGRQRELGPAHGVGSGDPDRRQHRRRARDRSIRGPANRWSPATSSTPPRGCRRRRGPAPSWRASGRCARRAASASRTSGALELKGKAEPVVGVPGRRGDGASDSSAASPA